jgi:PAS domain S-box-containing protein
MTDPKRTAAEDLLELGEPMCELDSEFRVVRVNAAQERLSGMPRAQVLGRTHWEVWPETAAPDSKFWREYHRCMTERVSTSFDSYSPSLDRFASVQVHPTPAGGLVIFIRDVSESRRAVLEQYRLANQRQLALDTARMGWWSVDLITGVTAVDRRYAEIFGLRTNSMTLDEFRQVVHPDDWGVVERSVALAIDPKRHGPLEVEYRIRRTDGEIRWVHSTAVPRFGDDPKAPASGMHGVLKDVTDRKEAELALQHALDATKKSEERLRHAQKMEAVGRLAGGVAHDFNNILTVILAGAEAVCEGLDRTDPLREDAVEILKAGERAAALTRQLLAFSRKQVLEPRVVDVNQLVQNLEKMLQRLVGEDLELSLHLAPRVHPCLIDPGQFEQALVNLAVNARDAMPEGGRLVIETANVELDERWAAEHPDARLGPHVRVSVTDTGVGMSAEVQSRIFEPFFTTKEPGRGTGLGLSTVYGIVQQSGGALSVTSVEGQGSTFRLFFPRAEQPVESPEPSPGPTPPVTGKETVLLVEDDAAVRSTVLTILRRGGYTVLSAANAGEAVLICEERQDPIHLLVSDVVMPRLNGRRLAERLRKTMPTLKVLFMSGYTADALGGHGVLEPGFDFIAKPVTSEALLRRVREILDR